jgi:hypothetical protein
LKRVWLNVNITTEAPSFIHVIKRHVNKDQCVGVFVNMNVAVMQIYF